jgi:ABC transport system ATP-binding/permease protein
LLHVLLEPTDLSTLAALEEYLTETFEGCLAVVSHDNFFMNRVAEHLFVFQGDGVVRDFQGSYTDYLEFRRDEKADAKLNSKALANRALDDQQSMDEGSRETDATDGITTAGDNRSLAAAAEGTSTTTTTIPAALSFNERKEFKKLEKEVMKLGVQIEQLEGQIATGSSRGEGYSVLNEWTTQLQKLKMQLEDKELRWIELAEK